MCMCNVYSNISTTFSKPVWQPWWSQPGYRVNFHNSKNAVLFSTAYIHKLCLYYVHCFASLTCEIGTTRFRMYGKVECYLESKTDTRHVGSNCVKTSIPKSYFLKLCFCVGFGLRKKNFLIGKWYTVTKVWEFHFTWYNWWC